MCLTCAFFASHTGPYSVLLTLVVFRLACFIGALFRALTQLRIDESTSVVGQLETIPNECKAVKDQTLTCKMLVLKLNAFFIYRILKYFNMKSFLF